MKNRNLMYIKAVLTTASALSLAACGSTGTYRVASVGSVAADDSATPASSSTTADNGSGTGSGSGSSTGSGTGGSGGSSTGSMASQSALGSKVLVTAGNSVIGVSGRQARLTNAGLLKPVTGRVTKVLTRTGQTLVDLGSGQSVILNSANGRIGEVVKIDLGSKSVIGAGAGSSLLGVGVSGVPATGRLAAVNVGNSAPLVTVGGTGITPGTTGVGTTSVVNGVVGTSGTGITGTAGAGTVGTLTTPLAKKTGSLTAKAGLTAQK